MSPILKIFAKKISQIAITLFVLASFFFISQPISADSTSGPFKSCTVSPTTVNPGQNVSLQIETDSVKLDATAYLFNRDTGENKQIPIKEETEKTIRTISLGSFSSPGAYDLQVQLKRNPNERCVVEKAFRVFPPATVSCPKFLSYNNTKFQEDTAIYAYFDSLPVPPPFYFGIHVDNNAHLDPLEDVRPPVGPPVGGDWRGFIGLLQDGDHTVSLLYSPSQKLSDASLCYELPKITVGETSGENPCMGGVCKTALGDIPTNPKEFAEKVLQIGIGLGGGIAFILMVIGSIRVLTSSGDQQKLSAGRDMIVAAISGLLFIIFSVLILEFIGIEIIGLSG